MSSSRPLRGIVLGVANEHSIAWGCAHALHAAGAEVALTYLNEKARPFVAPLAESIEAPLLLECNVEVPGSLEQVFADLKQRWNTIDFVIHSIAWAPLTDLHGPVLNCSEAGFLRAMSVSCHSLIRVANLAAPLMSDGGSILTMSYHGAHKVIPHYGMMGPVKAALESTVRYLAYELAAQAIRVNAISPGPMPTRAASGIDEFDQLMQHAIDNAPLHRLASLADVGNLANFLTSPATAALTGNVYYVDAGYHIVG
ncbi:enoyl-ACP reductase FabI [Burkholderiaceae bacterium DAT-1]|nr:enoyl-ACP reductase FabI [Burkholderiaceae bacterium DAT-1]